MVVYFVDIEKKVEKYWDQGQLGVKVPRIEGFLDSRNLNLA